MSQISPRPIRTRLPSTFGTLNVLFACMILLMEGCSGAGLLLQTQMGPMMEELVAEQKAKNEAKIEQLKAEEAKAKDETEQARLQKERERLERFRTPPMPDTSWATGPPLATWTIVDLVTGAALNVLLLVAGVGLLMYRDWARTLTIWVSAIKIPRLVLLYGVFLAVVVPFVADAMATMIEEQMDQLQAQQGGMPPGARPPNAETIAMIYGTMMSVFAVTMMVLGLIYPACCLWFLTRPAVRAACGGSVPRAPELGTR